MVRLRSIAFDCVVRSSDLSLGRGAGSVPTFVLLLGPLPGLDVLFDRSGVVTDAVFVVMGPSVPRTLFFFCTFRIRIKKKTRDW